MATVYKTFLQDDITTARTKLHEAIPITGTIVSGTYLEGNTEVNIKNPAHGMFQSTYDYPYLSSSSNHLFDITFGVSAQSDHSSSITTQQRKKLDIYAQMAKVLMGTDATGTILEIDNDGDIIVGDGQKMRECFFINFSRLLTKDEIKKGSFGLDLGLHEEYHQSHKYVSSSNDSHAPTNYFVNSPVGEYAVLTCSSLVGNAGSGYLGIQRSEGQHGIMGLLFYQAGILVLTASVLGTSDIDLTDDSAPDNGPYEVRAMITGSSIQAMSNALRHRINKISFNNTTELNSTIYFCRINHNDFNYSSNPTYLSASKILVKETHSDIPVSYITSVGLYSADNELLAVAKLSEPLRNDSTTNLTLRVRTDF